jgi:Holliday junction resolvasome RuvABC endonuclease subunit
MLDYQNSNFKVLSSSLIITPKSQFEFRLKKIIQELEEAIEYFRLDYMATEKLFS